MTKKEFMENAVKIHGYKYNYLNLKESFNRDYNLELELNGIKYSQKVCKHLIGRCPEKNTPTKSTEEFIKESMEIWGYKYDYSLTEYKGANKKVKIIYQGVVFEQTPSGHLHGREVEKNINKENFIKKSKEIHGERYDYSLITDIIKGNENVNIIHKGVIYSQKPYHHLIGNRPENIKLSVRKTTEQFILEGNEVHDFKYNYDKTNYITNQVKVIITCPIHGDFEQKPLSHIQGFGCLKCNESKGEKEISILLKKYNINFDRQKKFPDCRNIFELPFDFWIPSMNTLIEYDGRQHFEPIKHFGGQKAFERLKLNDKIKNDYCEDNYINLIRIKYDEKNIERILKDTIIAHKR